MATIIHETVKGREIADFLGKLKINPNQTFDIQIEVKPEKIIKGKWAGIAEKLGNEAHLDGIEEEFLNSTRNFRHNLKFKEPFTNTNE